MKHDPKQKDVVARWSRPPKTARSGRCDSPACEMPGCLDPFVTVFELNAEPMVIVTYVDAKYTPAVQVNGRRVGKKIFGRDYNTREEYEDMLEQMRTLLTDRFGELGAEAFLEHLERRSDFMTEKLMSQRFPGSTVVLLKPKAEVDA